MEEVRKVNNPYDDNKVIDYCSPFGMMNVRGEMFYSRYPVRAITNMHERTNSLGGGFAIYGIYPEYSDVYVLHIMYPDKTAKRKTQKCLYENLRVLLQEEIPTRGTKVWNPPPFWRYLDALSNR